MADNTYNARKMLKLTIQRIKEIKHPDAQLLRAVLLKHCALSLQDEVKAARARKSSVLSCDEKNNRRKRRKSC